MAVAISKDEFEQMLTMAHLTRAQFAARIDRDVRTVSRWLERGAIPTRYESLVRRALSVDVQRRPMPRPLADISDYVLLDEVAFRMHARRDNLEDSGWINADPPFTG